MWENTCQVKPRFARPDRQKSKLEKGEAVTPQAYLHIDMVLAVLIGKPGAGIERFMADAEEGKQKLLVLELALFYAVCSLRNDDRLDVARFARFLSCVTIVPSPKPFAWPTPDEIAHWREVVLGSNQPVVEGNGVEGSETGSA